MKKLLLNSMAAIFILLAGMNSVCAQMQVQMRNPNQSAMRAAELYQDASSALRMRRLTEARAILLKIIGDYPEDFYASLARRMLVEILRDLNEHEQAITMLKDMLKDGDDGDNQLWARENLCNLLYDLQRFREGVELLESWRGKSPNDLWIERQLARFYLQTGRKDEAWMILETMLERTASPAVFKDLLELSLKSGEVEKLLKTLDDRRTRFRSRDYSSFASDCYLALGLKNKAIEVIKATPDLNREWLLLEKLADLQIETGKIEDALQTLQQTDAIVPDNWTTLKKLGHCLFLLKRSDEAVEIWRRPFLRPQFQRQEQYLNYTTTLIEHQLYEEALQGFGEARQRLGSSSLFAEEVATVLEALGRKSEALNEYIQVFVNGHFSIDVFNKLFESIGPEFDLEKRLRQYLSTSYSMAVRQALLELYFRRQKPSDITQIVQLVVSNHGSLDNFIFERFRQEASVYADNFHFDLCRSLIEARTDSTLALRLAVLLLNMGRLEPIFAETAFARAVEVGRSNTTVDAELKAVLLVELADFAFSVNKDAKTAYELLDRILQSVLLKAAPARAVEAAIARAHIMICDEDYQQAQSLLAENHKNVVAARENIFAASQLGESDYLAKILLEQAFLALNQNDLQKSLDLLKEIVENLPESIWANDALELAMLVTRTSVGDFSLIKNLMQARRKAATGETKEAEKLYEKIVGENASMTAFISELAAEKILQASSHLESDEVLKRIDAFVKENPDHFKSADLLDRKLYILRRKEANENDIRELMQKFIDHFPNDLRSGRFKKLIEQKRLKLKLPEKRLPAIPQTPAGEAGRLLLPVEDADLDQIVPPDELLDLDETGDY